VLDRSSLEGVRAQRDLVGRARQYACDREAGRAFDVAGEVGDGHAALAGFFLAAGFDDDRVAEDEDAVAGAGLGVAGDVQGEHLGRDSDLGSGEAHAAGGDAHGGDQVGGEGEHDRV
jgi:hypothetical protein